MPSADSKAMNKEETEEDNKSLSSLVKKKPTNANNAGSKKLKKEDDDDDKPIRLSSSGSRSKPPVKKKEEIDDEDDEKIHVTKRNSSVAVSKEKKKTEKEEETKKKRERKVYDLPGQKRDQPEERDPLRIFYESLYKQIPTSDMAQIWLMESGLLPAEKAKKVLEKKLQKGGKFSSPTKSAASTPRSNNKSVPVKEAKKSPSEALSDKKKGTVSKPATKKRKKNSDDVSDDDSDDDFVASRVSKKPRAK
ncbi:PREDICTED: uncharacterized protein DDB_G0283697-like [Camelina sativa]|uniref:Uncharacterized protein DDB_G0283697-like n=1 Tax=Camelina sativa TaxID=90675 RepID=A0ABM0VQI9_CAMSA|nr:PREDICTED: uncharacterized protein DDB_G0283697-like [Camelina sativa]